MAIRDLKLCSDVKSKTEKVSVLQLQIVHNQKGQLRKLKEMQHVEQHVSSYKMSSLTLIL